MFLLGIGHVPIFLLGIALAVYCDRIPKWAAVAMVLLGTALYCTTMASPIGSALIIAGTARSETMQRALAVAVVLV